MSQQNDSGSSAGEDRIARFDILKASDFRSIHADGAFGGMTPQGQFCFTLYNERFPIPQKLAYRITPQGRVDEEIVPERVQRHAIVREAEVCVYMSIETMRSFSEFLKDQLAKIEEREKRERREVEEQKGAER